MTVQKVAVRHQRASETLQGPQRGTAQAGAWEGAPARCPVPGGHGQAGQPALKPTLQAGYVPVNCWVSFMLLRGKQTRCRAHPSSLTPAGDPKEP